MKTIRKLTVIFSTVMIIAVHGTATKDVLAEGITFSVEPVLPENQDKDISSYISISPDESASSMQFEFTITNKTDEEKEINMFILDAYTSPNGAIQYTDEESKNSTITSDDYKLSNYLKADDGVITLKEGETKTVSSSFDAEDMEGVLLGGVGFSAVEEGDEQKKDGSSFQINNKINMVIGVKVNFPANKETEFVIDKPFVDPMPSYFAIRLPVTLDAPVLQKDTKLKYQVTYKGEKLFDNQKEFSFAPYTKTNLSIPFEYDEIETNEDYVLKGELTYKDEQDNEKTKEFDETFQYSKDKVGIEDNHAATTNLKPPVEKDSSSTMLILLTATGVVVVGGAAFIVYRKQKSDVSRKNEA